MSNERHDMSQEEKLFWDKTEVPFKRSSNQVWDELSQQLNDSEETKPEPKIVPMNWFRLAAAAVVALLIGSSVFMNLYTLEVDCPRGEHLTHILPDGSQIELNAETSIQYRPYWWSFSRAVKLQGEAFFEVEKGSSFVVSSQVGTTTVL